MKVGDLVEFAWYDYPHFDEDLENFIGIVTGFDFTDCAYIEYHNIQHRFPAKLSIQKSRLRLIK